MEADGEKSFVSFCGFFEFAFLNKKRGGQFEILGTYWKGKYISIPNSKLENMKYMHSYFCDTFCFFTPSSLFLT